jgi:hypothetical protein
MLVTHQQLAHYVGADFEIVVVDKLDVEVVVNAPRGSALVGAVVGRQRENAGEVGQAVGTHELGTEPLLEIGGIGRHWRGQPHAQVVVPVARARGLTQEEVAYA